MTNISQQTLCCCCNVYRVYFTDTNSASTTRHFHLNTTTSQKPHYLKQKPPFISIQTANKKFQIPTLRTQSPLRHPQIFKTRRALCALPRNINFISNLALEIETRAWVATCGNFLVLVQLFRIYRAWFPKLQGMWIKGGERRKGMFSQGLTGRPRYGIDSLPSTAIEDVNKTKVTWPAVKLALCIRIVTNRHGEGGCLVQESFAPSNLYFSLAILTSSRFPTYLQNPFLSPNRRRYTSRQSSRLNNKPP
jgi:hypothetical protein